MKTSTRYLGSCPVCRGDFKVRSGKLVHHGYQRPGYGYIIGDCFAVGYEPHEVSPKAAEAFKAFCEEALKGYENYLTQLKAGEIKTLTRTTWDNKVIPVTAENDPIAFDRLLSSTISNTEMTIKCVKADIERLTKLIADWAPKALREVAEEKAAAKAVQDAKRAAKEEVRLAAVALKIQSYQKRVDSAVRRNNLSALVYTWESMLYNAYKLKLSKEEIIAKVDRPAVWAQHGLSLEVMKNKAVFGEISRKMHGY